MDLKSGAKENVWVLQSCNKGLSQHRKARSYRKTLRRTRRHTNVDLLSHRATQKYICVLTGSQFSVMPLSSLSFNSSFNSQRQHCVWRIQYVLSKNMLWSTDCSFLIFIKCLSARAVRFDHVSRFSQNNNRGQKNNYTLQNLIKLNKQIMQFHFCP